MPPATPLVEVIAYVDGAVNPNPGRGGWGVFLSSGTREKRLSGTVPEERTTNQRGEIHAAIRAYSAQGALSGTRALR